MHALYVFTCSETPSDWDVYPPRDASKFPSHYLLVLWSTQWNSSYRERDSDIPLQVGVGPLCALMSRWAITDPTSNYRPEDVILSIEHFVASSGVIGEAELRVFFGGLILLEYSHSSIIDDPARLLFYASLTLKLCQQSNVSMKKIFSLLMDAQKRYGSFRDKGHLLCILPLLRSLALKMALRGDNTATRVAETVLTDEVSPEADTFIDDFCSQLGSDYSSDPEHVIHGIVAALSLLPALGDPHLLAKQIVRRSQENNGVWREAFEYCDEYGESASLCPLMNAHSRTCSRQSHSSKASPIDSSTEQTIK
jgi:hypothetical protein